MNKVITIDGPSASGKGTLAILLAERLNWKILDSGALYRAFAYFSISENDERLIEQNLRKISFNIISGCGRGCSFKREREILDSKI